MNLIGKIKKLLGITHIDLGKLIAEGAKVIDVRTPGEFAGGHANGAVNIPLNTLATQLKRFKKDQPIITCCASGMRSRSAKAILQSHGYTQVYNGGSWHQISQYKK